MAKKKLTFAFEHEHNYTLIVIKSVLEDYRLAYFLNKEFNIKLKKNAFTLSFKKDKGEFNVFSFENKDNNQFWSLIANKQVINKEIESDNYNLFGEISSTFILMNEEKKADYFLKIENNNIKLTTLIKKINTMHKVITSYEINPLNLKSKDLLIF